MPKNKLNVLITRPEDAGRVLLQKCQNLGIAAQLQPFFRYRALATVPELHNLLSDNKHPIVIFVSVAAVEYAHSLKAIHQWQFDRVIAVGKATQQALAQYAICAACPELHTSEGLLSLPELANVNNRNVIIVRGDGGRELIAQTLNDRGARVNYLEVYQKQWLTFSRKIVQTWREDQVNCIVITSNALLESVINLIKRDTELTNNPFKDDCLSYWQEQCLWIVASERIAATAKKLGLVRVVNANGANDQATLAALSHSRL